MTKSRTATPPAISVIVPTYKRQPELERCLRALSDQTYPRDGFEVIVVDDGSDSSLEPAIAPFRESLRLRLIEQKNAGPARARNLGAEHAAGALLAFIDDDCEAHPEWLAALNEQFHRWPDRAIGGATVNGLPENVYSAATQDLVDYLCHYDGAPHEQGAASRTAPPFFTLNNLAVPAALFHHVGGFNVSFRLAAGEDREFCDRWQGCGYGLQNAPDAKMQHMHALSFAKFWRQHMNYGRGAFHFRRARTERGAPAIGFEPMAFYGRLLTFPLRRGWSTRGLLLMVLLGVAQAANALGFILEMRRRPS
jgi:glycosyltransferase involved in cell wall biosynthesis